MNRRPLPKQPQKQRPLTPKASTFQRPNAASPVLASSGALKTTPTVSRNFSRPPTRSPTPTREGQVTPKNAQPVRPATAPPPRPKTKASVKRIISRLESATKTDEDGRKKSVASRGSSYQTGAWNSTDTDQENVRQISGSPATPAIGKTESTSTLFDLPSGSLGLIEYRSGMITTPLQSTPEFIPDNSATDSQLLTTTTDQSLPKEPEFSVQKADTVPDFVNESDPPSATDDTMSIQTSRSDDDNMSIRTEDFISKDGEVKENAVLYSDDDQSVLGTSSTAALATEASRAAVPDADKGDDDDEIELQDTGIETTKTKSCKTNTTIYSHVLTTKNFKKMDWTNGFIALTVKKCLNPINDLKLETIRDTLTSLKFSNLTSFKTILSFIQNCKKIERLAFTNVQLVQKQESLVITNATEPTVGLPKLKELELTEWVFSLTKNEYWLLDFFYRYTTLPRLESFTLRGSDSFQWERSLRKAESRLREIDDPSIVIKFLIKHHSTLKKVSLGGLGFQMLGASTDISKLTPELASADSFRDLRIPLNAIGISCILQHQRNLHRLSCCGFLPHFGDSLKEIIYSCVDRNRETLESVGIFPCILQDNFKGSGAGLYDYSCSDFQFCSNLKHLFINVTTAHKAFTRRHSCGRVTHLHLLPATLVSLEIYTHKLEAHDLEQLGGRFGEFLNLQKLVLSTNIKKCYRVPLDWIQRLFDLPMFYLADFFGGCVNSRMDFDAFLASRQEVSMAEIMDCVSFTRKLVNENGTKEMKGHRVQV